MFNWFNFLIYVVVTAITPGPNNIMSMTNAGRLGFKRALPFNFGIFAGFCCVVTLCTVFSSLLSTLIPIIELPMLVLGAVYILYLAWKTWKSSDVIQEKEVKNSFFSGMFLQFVNPKFYIYCIVSMDAYILAYYGDNIAALAGFAFLLCFIGFACTLLWSGLGSLFKLLFSKYAKITNTIMALLLVYCAASLFFPYIVKLNMKFFLMFTAALLIGSTYLSLRLIPRTSLSGIKKYLVIALCYLPIINMPIRYEVRQLGLSGAVTPPWLEMGLFASHILMGALSIFVTVTFAVDLYLIAKKIFVHFNKSKQGSEQKTQCNTSRRIFLQNSLSAGVVVASSAVVGYGMSEAMGMPAMKHIQVPIKNLAPEFQGFTIAQLTDLHINKPVSPTRLEKIVAKINELNPDCVVMTGDLSDSYPAQVQVELNPLLKLNPKHGKYFVSGNHEYYTGIELWLEEVKRLEFINLQNEHRAIERAGKRLLMCGVPDITAPRMSSHISDPILAQDGSSVNDIKVLLAHQPQSIYDAVKGGYDLQISGHTHGGQFFPWTYVTDFIQPYIHGLYTVENTQLYVSRGTGYWGPPIRIGAPAEVAFLELVKA